MGNVFHGIRLQKNIQNYIKTWFRKNEFTNIHLSMIRTLKILLIIALPLIAFLNTLDNTFVYDDVFTITDNYFIRDWGNFSAFKFHQRLGKFFGFLY